MHTLSFLPGVRYWTWSERKNEVLRESGRPTFDDVRAALEAGGFVASERNPRYPGQGILIVTIGGYAHGVPYRLVDDNTGVFITVYPSRAFQRRYGKAEP